MPVWLLGYLRKFHFTQSLLRQRPWFLFFSFFFFVFFFFLLRFVLRESPKETKEVERSVRTRYLVGRDSWQESERKCRKISSQKLWDESRLPHAKAKDLQSFKSVFVFVSSNSGGRLKRLRTEFGLSKFWNKYFTLSELKFESMDISFTDFARLENFDLN